MLKIFLIAETKFTECTVVLFWRRFMFYFLHVKETRAWTKFAIFPSGFILSDLVKDGP